MLDKYKEKEDAELDKFGVFVLGIIIGIFLALGIYNVVKDSKPNDVIYELKQYF